VGAVQKLATVVIFGLVGLATVLVLYMADENNRIDAEEASLNHDAIERAEANYASLCLSCHGPAGEGYMGPGEMGTGRIGAPLGGNTFATALNQRGENPDGSPASQNFDTRTEYLTETIHNGKTDVGMPAWGEENNGPLNPSQIEEMVYMIQHVDWNELYNKVIEENGGVYPSPEPNDPRKTATPDTGETTPTPTGGDDGGEGSTSIDLAMQDIHFDKTELSIPANTDVTLNLVNEGAGPHDFTIDGHPEASSELYNAGQTGTITLNLPPGTYEYYCNVPGHKQAGMTGTLTVK
jgi:plastocyanin